MRHRGSRAPVRPATALLLFFAVVLGHAAAAPAAEPSPPAPQRALLDLKVNEAPGETVLVLLLGEDAYLEPKILQDAGLAEIDGVHRAFDGKDMVSLQSLAPRLTFKVDVDALTLTVTADPALFVRSTVDLGSRHRPAEYTFRSDLGGFMNYSLEAATGAGLGAFTEFGGTYKTFLLSTGLERAPGTDHTVRTLTSLTYDQPDALRRWVFGEATASTGVLGGGALLAGIGVRKEFSLDPYRTYLPLPQITGTAATPSRLDVYVNGQLVRQEMVPTGVFELQNLPVPTGAASVRYVLRDAYGRTQEFGSRFYLASGLLRTGETDYAYNLGFTRLDTATRSFSFDPHPLLLAHHRMGLSDHLTAGGRMEIGPTLVSGGPSLAFGLPVGELQANLAASLKDNLAGTAAQLSYVLQTRRYSAGASAQLQSRFYSRAGMLPQDDRELVSLDVFASHALSSAVTLSGAYRHDAWRDHGSTDTFEVRASYALTNWGAVLVGAQRSSAPGGTPEYAGNVSLAISLGEHVTGQVSTERSGDRTHFAADVEQSLPLGTGLGYRLHGDDHGGSEALMFQSEYGRYEGDYTNESGNEGGQLFASGSVVFLGGKMFAARPIQQGYALVRVPGVPNVRTLLNNQEVGRTDKDGDVLVPNLLPYYGNRLAIVPTDIPLDYEIPPVEKVVATPNRGGALVTFRARRIVAFSGSVVLREGLLRVSPSYGQLDVQTPDEAQSSPLGKNGEFYLENLSPGDYPAHVQSDNGDCDFVLSIPDTPEKFVDLGAHTCRGKFETPLPLTSASRTRDSRETARLGATSP